MGIQLNFEGSGRNRAEVQKQLKEAKDELVRKHLVLSKSEFVDTADESGDCPHGNSCHFRHLNPDGEEVTQNKPRFLLSAGETVVTGSSELASLPHWLTISIGASTRVPEK